MSTAGKILVRPGAIAASIVRRSTSGGVRRHASNLKPANQDKGYFLDLGPHRKREGWEEIMVATGVASAAILIIGLGYGPETSIKEWARNEALARNAREAKGLPLEYGKIYSQEPVYAFTPAEGDDEDEDDEDDEEEDEEE